MGDKAVRLPRTSRSHKIDMSCAVRPYIGGPRSGARGECGRPASANGACRRIDEIPGSKQASDVHVR